MFRIVLTPEEKGAITVAMRRHIEFFESYAKDEPDNLLVKRLLEDTKSAYVKIGVFL